VKFGTKRQSFQTISSMSDCKTEAEGTTTAAYLVAVERCMPTNAFASSMDTRWHCYLISSIANAAFIDCMRKLGDQQVDDHERRTRSWYTIRRDLIAAADVPGFKLGLQQMADWHHNQLAVYVINSKLPVEKRDTFLPAEFQLAYPDWYYPSDLAQWFAKFALTPL
jgi:hypothetical protein